MAPNGEEENLDRSGFAKRLRRFLSSRYGSLYGFAFEPRPAGARGKRRERFPYAALKKWTNERRPQSPIEPSLVQFAKLSGVSLDWLVFEVGDELRDAPASFDDLALHLHAKVRAELSSAGFKPAEIAQCLPDREDLLTETLDYWMRAAEKDRRDRRNAASERMTEQLVATLRQTKSLLRERKGGYQVDTSADPDTEQS